MPHLTELIEYPSATQVVPKINDYRLKLSKTMLRKQDHPILIMPAAVYAIQRSFMLANVVEENSCRLFSASFVFLGTGSSFARIGGAARPQARTNAILGAEAGHGQSGPRIRSSRLNLKDLHRL